MSLDTRVAGRVKFHEARRAFENGATILVSEYGHEPTLTVHRDTTTHTRETITWSALAAEVRRWRNRWPNQRFYVVHEPGEAELAARANLAKWEAIRDQRRRQLDIAEAAVSQAQTAVYEAVMDDAEAV